MPTIVPAVLELKLTPIVTAVSWTCSTSGTVLAGMIVTGQVAPVATVVNVQVLPDVSGPAGPVAVIVAVNEVPAGRAEVGVNDTFSAAESYADVPATAVPLVVLSASDAEVTPPASVAATALEVATHVELASGDTVATEIGVTSWVEKTASTK
jgi:hypothetical protein